MDIQLSDGSCFDIFRRMEIRTPVIFTTAYDQYALDAFKVNSIDYLLKPIDEDGLIAAVGKLNYRYDRIRDLVSAYFAPAGRYKSRISAKCGDTYKSLSIDDIAYFISEDGITFAVSSSGEKRIVDYTIESLEPLLDPKSFFRITRGCLASIGSIEKASRYFSGMSNSIVMLRLPVSKTFAKHFKIFFGPTINMGLQDIREQDSQLAPWTMWTASFDGLHAAGWIGLAAGLRF